MISAAMTIITKAIVWIAENYQLETSPDPVYTEGKGFFYCSACS